MGRFEQLSRTAAFAGALVTLAGCEDTSDAEATVDGAETVSADGKRGAVKPIGESAASGVADKSVGERGQERVAAKAALDEEDRETATRDDGDGRGSTARPSAAKRRTARVSSPAGRARSTSDSDGSAPTSGSERAGHGPEPGVVPELEVKRLVVSRDVRGREPIDEVGTLRLSDAERVFAFVELTNPDREESFVNVTFVSPAGAPIEVRLDIGASPRWRTWAVTRKVNTPGTWTVTVRGADGAELSRTQFEVKE